HGEIENAHCQKQQRAREESYAAHFEDPIVLGPHVRSAMRFACQHAVDSVAEHFDAYLGEHELLVAVGFLARTLGARRLNADSQRGKAQGVRISGGREDPRLR
ncbi:MAG TPA: hypothetical protein VIV40_08925, partial [Kofleriaceae bacterium]